MLFVREYDKDNNHRILSQGKDLFHRALSFVFKGEKRFHVINGSGIAYDLEYIDNQAWAESFASYPDSPLFHRDPLYPPYFFYDEEKEDRLCMDIFEGLESVVFEEVNEYGIVITGILLEHTELKVYWADERIRWFYPKEERIGLIKEMPAKSDKNMLRVVKDFYPSAFICDFFTMDAASLFHHIFLFQWLTDIDLKDVRYAEIMVAKSEGIGSILTLYSRARDFFKRFNAEVTLAEGSSRYADSIIEKYFNIRMTPSDSNENNTIYITNYYGLLFTRMLRYSHGRDFDAQSLNETFLAQMREYSEAVISDKRMLGILLRGSDYIASGMSGASAPIKVSDALPVIREWMDSGDYDGIFLATEDKDILTQMLDAFPGKITAVAQERYSINDFNGVNTISELDSQRHTDGEYDDYLEDSLVNYFYALYLLSRCEAFMYSGQCGGVVLTKSLCERGFKRMWCFAQNKEISE